MSNRVLNPDTNRYVKKGTRTYKILVNSGIISQSKKMNENESDSEVYESEESNSDSALLQENKEEKYDYESESSSEGSESSSEGSELRNDRTDIPSWEEVDNMDDEELNRFREYLRKFQKK